MSENQLGSVADPIGDIEHLVREGKALDERVWAEQRSSATVEGVRERGGVSGPSGKFERLAADRVASISRWFVAQRSRQASEKPSPQLDILCGSRCQALFE
jgi:hypothetical protein